jgi:uncharacterized membrane protein
MFELFLKYPKSTWQHAELVFASGWPAGGLVAAIVLAMFAIVVSLQRQNLSKSRRLIVGVLQAAVISIALLMLWQPSLKLEQMQPGENSVAYLLDTSASMLASDSNQQSRLQQAQSLLNDAALTRSTLFDSTVYSMDESLTVINPDSQSIVAGKRSAIADNLKTVLETVSEQSLAAVVLLSDGANNVGQQDSEWWQAIKAAGVPVHTVGFGSNTIINDIELSDVAIDTQVSENSSVVARLQLQHNGFNRARVRVQAGEELLYADDITLNPQALTSFHSIRFNSGEAGTRDLRFSVVPVDDNGAAQLENNTVNNRQQRVLDVGKHPKRILYVEGEPRWEYKFIRRALHGFNDVEVVSFLRTSPNKFYRQGVKDASELADGFPKTREKLFVYDAIIIGSLEAAELSADQQANLRDFVSQRGGSLLMLAGRRGLGDGGWGRSAVASALPVTLSARKNALDYERIRVPIQLSTQGVRTPWLNIVEPVASAEPGAENADERLQNIEQWAKLPAAGDVQSIGDIKPGATVLLTAQVGNRLVPALAWHRYGQGQSFVFGTSGTWRWQMGMPSEDQSHELFWQQFLSHIAAGALSPITFESTQAVYRDTPDIPVSVVLKQSDFTPVESGEVIVDVTLPSGDTVATTLVADIDQPGRFIGSVAAPEDGPYSMLVKTPALGEAQTATDSTQVKRWWIKESNTAEQFGSALKREYLQRISAATGGRYLDASNGNELADILKLENAGLTREVLLSLWNLPVFFLALIFLKGLEWLLRLRWKRL